MYCREQKEEVDLACKQRIHWRENCKHLEQSSSQNRNCRISRINLRAHLKRHKDKLVRGLIKSRLKQMQLKIQTESRKSSSQSHLSNKKTFKKKERNPLLTSMTSVILSQLSIVQLHRLRNHSKSLDSQLIWSAKGYLLP